jgi:hypothetical protein
MAADFADASLVAMAERLNLSRVAGVDGDFAVYRALGRRAFEDVFLRDGLRRPVDSCPRRHPRISPRWCRGAALAKPDLHRF